MAKKKKQSLHFLNALVAVLGIVVLIVLFTLPVFEFVIKILVEFKSDIMWMDIAGEKTIYGDWKLEGNPELYALLACAGLAVLVGLAGTVSNGRILGLVNAVISVVGVGIIIYALTSVFGDWKIGDTSLVNLAAGGYVSIGCLAAMALLSLGEFFTGK